MFLHQSNNPIPGVTSHRKYLTPIEFGKYCQYVFTAVSGVITYDTKVTSMIISLRRGPVFHDGVKQCHVDKPRTVIGLHPLYSIRE